MGEGDENSVTAGDSAAPRRGIRPLLRRHPAVAAVVLVIVLVAAGFGGLQTYRAVAIATAQAAYNEALAQSRAAQTSAGVDVASAEDVLTAAETTLTDSEGKVLSEDPRTALAAALDLAEDQLTAAHDELAAAEDGIDDPTTDTAYFAPGDGLRQGSATLAGLHFDAASELRSITDTLAGPVQAVTDAVALWQAEYDRMVSERYTNNTHATGWYPELDECIGSVDVTAHYGVPTIAEHWSCGGREFPDDAGTIITLTGVHAGSYRVEGIAKMLNANRDSTADLPQGFDLLYQTCQNGQSSSMSFTGLTRIES
ncbi:hypothetical protein D6T64_07990 [Cryobacterium melibiosiphilum]|uniref:Uncharacterized protein n=1 Tax=Cryobacterium melibiosiphilum TaxID=995039 RepID=A0A3A5MJV5_9MICO|nr:hypothetical protein [Cryobacterium melibiosiphilum]RJT89191.1 hypothetical protein D6T64_07990 [Cryobacterium melibiosiphilum]